jgi:uncharacterized membrane protein YwaF
VGVSSGRLSAVSPIWWTFLLTVLPAHLFAQLRVPWWTAIGWFITHTGEALIGAFCITHFTRRRTFDSVRGVVAFVVFWCPDRPVRDIIP